MKMLNPKNLQILSGQGGLNWQSNFMDINSYLKNKRLSGCINIIHLFFKIILHLNEQQLTETLNSTIALFC